MTGEGKSATEKWVEEKRAAYGYAYDTGLKLMRELGLSGFPSAVLIDPSGTIVWSGHPASLQGGTLEPHLEGAFSKPMLEWPRSAKRVRSALARRDYAKALAAAEKVEGAEGAEILAGIRGIIAGRMAALEQAREKGNYLLAQNLADELEDELSGLPEGEQAAEILDALKDDDEVQRVIDGQEEVLDLREDFDELVEKGKRGKKDDADELIEEYQEICEEYAGTYAEEQARGYIEKLMKMRSLLR